MNRRWFLSQLDYLASIGYKIQTPANLKWVCISGIELRGRWWTDAQDIPIRYTSVLIDIPPDFPVTVPGVGFTHPRYAIHIPLIKWKGSELLDLHECRHKPWYWLCFESIDWDPKEDNLITLLQIIETSIYQRR